MQQAISDFLDVVVLDEIISQRRVRELLADSTSWQRALASDDVDGQARRVLLEALRVDLPQLLEYPSLAFDILYARLYFCASPDAVRYGRPESRVSERLNAFLRSWLETYRAHLRRTRPRDWARPLRPVRSLLFGPLLAEYRADVDCDELYLSPDGAIVAAASFKNGQNKVFAWDRASGARRALPEFPRRVAPRATWVDGRWQRFEPEEEQLVSSLQHPAGAVPSGLTRFERCLLVTYETDYDDPVRVARFDLPRRAPTWFVEVQYDVSRLSAQPDSPVFLLSSSREIVVLSMVSGQVQTVLATDVSDVALGSTGQELATLDRGVVQVWEIARIQGLERNDTPSRRGWVSAMYSPDSETLLTGSLLCRGRSGEPIAALRLDGPGYLEGGPARDARRLGNDQFVEISPFYGVAVWSTRTGDQLQSERLGWPRFRPGHRLVFSPDTKCFVALDSWSKEPSPCSLYGLESITDEHRVALLCEDACCARFSESSDWVAVGDRHGVVHIYRVADGALQMRLAAHDTRVAEVVFSAHEHALLTSGYDGWVRLWNTSTGQKLAERRTISNDDTHDEYGESEQKRAWKATPSNLAHIDGWFGFSSVTAPSLGRHEGAAWVIRDRLGDEVSRLLCNRYLIASPDGKSWANGEYHYTIERL